MTRSNDSERDRQASTPASAEASGASAKGSGAGVQGAPVVRTPVGGYRLLGQSPSQTVGPYFKQGLLRTRGTLQLASLCDAEVDLIGNRLRRTGVPGRALLLCGRVFDGLGRPVTDAVVELWQADCEGRLQHPLDPRGSAVHGDFNGFGRASTHDGGRYWFETICPGPVPAPGGGWQAPHVTLLVGARGLTRFLHTRAYLPGEPLLAGDPVLACAPPERRRTLMSEAMEAGRLAEWGLVPAQHEGLQQAVLLEFDIHLQGEQETVFLSA